MGARAGRVGMLVLWRLLAVLAVCAGLSWVAGAAGAELVKRSAAVDRSR